MNTSNENSKSRNTPPEAKKPRFSILHTSARPHAWRAVYDAWLAAADHPEDVEYILVVDERWGFDAGWNLQRVDSLPARIRQTGRGTPAAAATWKA